MAIKSAQSAASAPLTGSHPPAVSLFGPESPTARAVRTVLTVLLCAQFTLEFIAEKPFLVLATYAAGRAMTPYQLRVLPMLVMRPLDRLGPWQRIAAHMPLADHSPELLAMAALAFCGMLAAVYATRGIIRALTGDPSLARWFCLLVPVMSVFTLCSTWGLNYSLPYDVPSLAFFATCLWLIVSGRLLWLYPVFALATLNRETTIFLVVFLAVWEWQSGKPRAAVAAHAGGLAAIWLALKLAVGHAFRGNPAENTGGGGGLFIHHFGQNLKYLLEPQQWPVLLSVCGFTLPLLWLGRRWLQHRAYTAAMLTTMGLWFVGMLIVGVLVEIRIFTEWAALVTPALALMAHNRFRPASAVQAS